MCRLLATAGTWFLWDFSFYGNKIFQSTFIHILSPSASLFVTIAWTLLNSCASPGCCVLQLERQAEKSQPTLFFCYIQCCLCGRFSCVGYDVGMSAAV